MSSGTAIRQQQARDKAIAWRQDAEGRLREVMAAQEGSEAVYWASARQARPEGWQEWRHRSTLGSFA